MIHNFFLTTYNIINKNIIVISIHKFFKILIEKLNYNQALVLKIRTFINFNYKLTNNCMIL
jgi:hypothetical protein